MLLSNLLPTPNLNRLDVDTNRAGESPDCSRPTHRIWEEDDGRGPSRRALLFSRLCAFGENLASGHCPIYILRIYDQHIMSLTHRLPRVNENVSLDANMSGAPFPAPVRPRPGEEAAHPQAPKAPQCFSRSFRLLLPGPGAQALVSGSAESPSFASAFSSSISFSFSLF